MKWVYFVLLFAFSGDAFAQKVPSNSDLARYVRPGDEGRFLAHLPETVEAADLGLELSPGATMESVIRQYPRDYWNSGAPRLEGGHFRDPDDKTGQRILYFYGLENAHRAAYRNMATGFKDFKAAFFGTRAIAPEMPGIDEVTYDCMSYTDSSMLSMFTERRTEERIRSGDWWFSCRARLAVPMFVGRPRP